MDNPNTQTALTKAAPISSEHTLCEAALCGKINLRGNIDKANFRQAVDATLGVSLPEGANTVSNTNGNNIFWLGPDEWLAHVPLASLDKTITALRENLAGQHVAITDVSDYYSVIELSGPQARDIIACASPFDIRPNIFPVGQCAQTRFGHASILLWPLNEVPSFRVQIRWSYAQYVYGYLSESIQNAENLHAFQKKL